MKHCKYSDDPCAIYPQKVGDREIFDLKEINTENIYRYGEWGIDITKGIKLHKHGKDDYGVFYHFLDEGIKPILVCSSCEEQIPDNVYNVLCAAYNLLNLHDGPNPVRRGNKDKAYEVLQYAPGYINYKSQIVPLRGSPRN